MTSTVALYRSRAAWLLAGLLWPAVGQAQSAPRPLPLAEAVILAVQQSNALKRNLASQNVAQARVAQAKNVLLPSVAVTSNFFRISDNITPFVVPFPGAGQVTLNPQILNQSFNNFQVRQLLWAGGRVCKGIAVAEREAQATAAEADQYRLAAADNVTTIWYTLYTLNASERIIRENINVLQDRRRDLTNLENQGVVLKVDGLKIDLTISQLASSLADLRAGQATNNFNLAIATGLPPTTEFAIDPAELPGTATLGALDGYLQEALQKRPELQALGLRREEAVLNQRIARAGSLPSLSFGGNVDYNRPNQRVFPNEAAFKATSSVFASFSFDIGGLYTNRARVAESRFRVDEQSATIADTRDRILSEVNANYRTYEQQTERIRLQETALAQATENFRVEQNRLKANVSTPTDFLDANTQLLQAQLNLRSAQANAELARWKLLKSTGRLPLAGSAN